MDRLSFEEAIQTWVARARDICLCHHQGEALAERLVLAAQGGIWLLVDHGERLGEVSAILRETIERLFINAKIVREEEDFGSPCYFHDLIRDAVFALEQMIFD